MTSKNNLAYLLLVLTTLFWSGNFIVGKAASIYEIPPFSLNFFRWFFACLILMPFTFKELIKKLSKHNLIDIESKARSYYDGYLVKLNTFLNYRPRQ